MSTLSETGPSRLSRQSLITSPGSQDLSNPTFACRLSQLEQNQQDLVVRVETVLRVLFEQGEAQAELLTRVIDIGDLLVGQTKESYTVAEVAKRTRRTEGTVRRWCRDGRIHATRVAGTGSRGRLLISAQALQDLMRSGLGEELPALAVAPRRERLAVIQAAKHRLEEEARVAAEAERQRRQEAEAERQRRGQKARGKTPKPVQDLPDDKAQMNFTDPELAIMKVNNKGWDCCGNAQASVDGGGQIILACDVTDAANDKQQAVPMAQATQANLKQAEIERPRDEAGQEQKIPATADSGYYSEHAAKGLEAAGFDPYIATGRQKHHAPERQAAQVGVSEMIAPRNAASVATWAATTLVTVALVATDAAEAAPPSPATVATRASARASATTAKEQMAAKVRAPTGRALYARRKVIVEPVFGQIKGARGFRRFLLRGLTKVRGEWRLVCLTHNLLKIWRHQRAPTGS